MRVRKIWFHFNAISWFRPIWTCSVRWNADCLLSNGVSWGERRRMQLCGFNDEECEGRRENYVRILRFLPLQAYFSNTSRDTYRQQHKSSSQQNSQISSPRNLNWWAFPSYLGNNFLNTLYIDVVWLYYRIYGDVVDNICALSVLYLYSTACLRWNVWCAKYFGFPYHFLTHKLLHIY
jgi:hypothetical protein